ncbi:MAG: hypothetical protein GQ533_05530 [Methanosarcinaceae archaeon]|nr:hypothetical protein [Methanosarcinaceae archaeon]
MREAGEPMEFGIFYFYKVFSRAFGEEGNGAGGDLEWKVGDVINDLGLEIRDYREDARGSYCNRFD